VHNGDIDTGQITDSVNEPLRGQEHVCWSESLRMANWPLAFDVAVSQTGEHPASNANPNQGDLFERFFGKIQHHPVSHRMAMHGKIIQCGFSSSKPPDAIHWSIVGLDSGS
jgi:hypothetical protein